MKWIHLTPILGLVLLLGACTGSRVGQSTRGGDRDRITPEQIQEARGALNAYALVERLRPNWLRKRGRHSITNEGNILVYVDGMRYGEPASLRNLQVIGIQSMEFLGAGEATTRYGVGHDHGVILVHMKGGG